MLDRVCGVEQRASVSHVRGLSLSAKRGYAFYETTAGLKGRRKACSLYQRVDLARSMSGHAVSRLAPAMLHVSKGISSQQRIGGGLQAKKSHCRQMVTGAQY